MTIGVIQDFEGTLDLYDEATARLNPKENPPLGLVFHWCAQLDNAHIRITDVWESQQSLDQWNAQTREVLQDLNIPEPQVRVFDVHNYQSGQVSSTMSDPSQSST